MPMLTERVDRAILLAMKWHRFQVRKNTDVPYASHLLAVAGMVAEMGGNEDEIIAALLHDAAEDQGGRETLEVIRRNFGPGVADTVAGCSDTFETPKPPWKSRKEEYIAHLATATQSTLLVSLADKIHNARSIVFDLRQQGPGVFEKFQGAREGTLWYYRSIAHVLTQREFLPYWTDELIRLVDEMHRLAMTT